jgi:hypothetical protein
VTLLAKGATNNILRVWCIPHQMDIVIKKVMKAMMDGLFYKITHVFLVHLCVQLNLNTVGGIWEDAQMIFPSPLSAAIVHRR